MLRLDLSETVSDTAYGLCFRKSCKFKSFMASGFLMVNMQLAKIGMSLLLKEQQSNIDLKNDLGCCFLA
jgi:hypothetical protein